MKKQIFVTEKTTRPIEVEVPSFYRWHGMYYAITELSVITVADTFASSVCSIDKDRYSNSINEVLKYGPTPIEQQEFDKAFNKHIKCLTEQYQLSINMAFDPNNAQAAPANQEAIAEQAAAVQAVEQEAQEQAMESAEEGITEG